MNNDNKAVKIEISDEAYKQNTVYRPWSDIKAGIHATKPYTTPGQQQSLKNQINRG